jgi:uncharacterized protein YidB (DUF937 family)
MSDLDKLEKKYEKGSKAKEIRNLAEQLRTHDGLPARKNADGSYSTELSITVTDPRLNRGRPTNIPSLWGGKEVDEDAAVSNALKSNKKYRSFASIAEAETAAKARSNAGGASADAEIPFNPDTKRAFESRKETLESIIRSAKQATAGFRSQWSGLDDEGKVGMGKGTPGIYYNTVALPALAGVVDEKYAPDFAVEADKKAGKIKEAVRKDMGINEPRGPLEHFSYAGGEMIGQIPVPGAWMNKIVGGVKKLGTTGKIAAAPVEYLTPTVDPRALNYGIGTTFGGTLGTVLEEEPTKKALGGLIQKYENGGKVGRVKSFFSAVDQAIDTLKQKKGTGEQILKQLEATPGVKKEELEARGIKQKLQASPKITQEELQKVAKQNKPSIPKRIKLGQGIDPDWQPRLEKHLQEAFDELNIQPVVDPNTGQNFGFMHPETGEILDRKAVRALTPEELGLPVNPETGKIPLDDKESSRLYLNVRQAVDEADQQFNLALNETKTKFGNFSKSGGKDNYREILLQNQDEQVPGAPAISQRIDELLKSNPETEEQAKAINEELDSLLDKISSKRQNFTAGHWNQPNVMAHYRVSDMTGPNGEKVLYVDEIQSDWHQKARDSRKREIKRLVNQESDSIRNQAMEELTNANDPALKYTYDTWHNHFLDSGTSPEVAASVAKQRAADTYFKMPENAAKLKAAQLRIKKERTAQLEKEVDENFGYKTPEDDEKLYQLNSQIERIRNTGLTTEELKDYFQPGKIVPSYGGKDKVLSFNSGENSEAFKQSYERKLAQARSAGVDEAAAEGWARRRALADAGDGWSVTVIEVDPATGQPRRGAGQRTHNTSPGSHVVEELRQQTAALESKVPDAPFKKNWHELAVRDILDLAAKEGYDKVAFSPGVEQVKRYASGLRQAVDEIQFGVHEDGSLFITGTKGSNPVFNGRVIGDTFIDGQAEGKSLSEVFGSNIAKQIEDQAPDLQEQMKSFRGIEMPDDKDAGDLLWQYGDKMTDDQRAWLRDFSERWELDVDDTPAGESMAGTMTEEYTNWLRNNRLKISPSDKPPISRISGENLTIGGEGMKSFYDKRLPDYVKEYGKKEFKAPTSYLEFKGTESPKNWSARDVQAEMDRIDDMDRMDLMERAQDITQTRATEALARRGITPDTPNIDWQDVLWDEMDNHMDEAHGIALRELAVQNLTENAGKTPGLRTFSIDVTPEMKEKINTQGQRLHGFVAPQILPPLAAGAAGAEYVRQSVQQPPAEPQEPPQEQAQEPPEEPQAFQKGGKVGSMKDAAESLLRVLHGSPTKVRLDKEKNLDVTTDESYAMKRARDKMEMFGQSGPPMLNKFDVPAAKMLRFQETYSPEDVALMRRFFNRLPEGKSMTGEEIYDTAGGKDFVMEGIAKAGGMAGYERPAGGSGGVGNWYRVTDQEALTRKARGGLIQGYADGGAKGGKVDLARRGILGLSRLFEEPAQTANLPAVIPTAPAAKVPEATSPLSQLVQKTAETPMSRRDVLKKAGNVAISQAAKGVVPMALKEAVLEAIPIKVSPVGNVENAVKNLYINQMFDNFYDDAAGHGGTLFEAYESFLPFISQSLSKSEKKAIEKARDLFYEYGEDEIPSRIYDRISKGVDILQEKISEKGNDIPIKDVLSPDMYKMSLEDMKDYGVEITPDMVEQLRKTEWAPDVFHEFDTP